MVRSIGIDPGDHTVKVVELDGSYRKTRLLRVHAVPLPFVQDVAARAAAVGAAAEEAIGQGMRGDVTVGHPCREAVLRSIELPFKGHDAIRKVIKAEIEGEIHSHVVDDMIVDFHEVGPGTAGGTRVLVASVPKEGLRIQLDALTDSGIEAETVDLDTMALWRAAHWAGAFEAEEDDAAAAESAGGDPVTAVVDLGARSVKVLLVEGEQLVDMRALRIGDDAVTDEIARRTGMAPDRAREAVRECLSSGRDQVVEVEDALPAPAGGAATGEGAVPTPAVLRKVTVACADVEAAQTGFLQRVARELTRYLTACGKSSRIRALWITGGAANAPGMKEMLGEVFGVESKPLDLLSKLNHDLDDDVVADLGPRLAVAIGLALAKFGGPEGMQLRQEDLVVTRGFERIKFPLAICCLVGWLALFVHGNKRAAELRNLELRIGSTYVDRSKPNAPIVFHGMVNRVLGTKWFEDKQHFSWARDRNKDYVYKDLVAELDSVDVHRRLQLIHDKLKLVADQKQKESGIYEDVSLESGLAVLVRYSEMLKSVHDALGRYLVPKLDLNMKPGSRRLEFTIAFRGDDFRPRMATLQQAIEAEYARPDSPFEKPPANRDGMPETKFSDSEQSGVPGAYFRVTMPIKDVFAPFGVSADGGAK